MKPKPKSLQYFQRVRRIARRIVDCMKELKAVETNEITNSNDPAVHALAEKISNRQRREIDVKLIRLKKRQRELEELGFTSITLFLISLLR